MLLQYRQVLLTHLPLAVRNPSFTKGLLINPHVGKVVLYINGLYGREHVILRKLFVYALDLGPCSGLPSRSASSLGSRNRNQTLDYY
jgi:hypothetical protein